MYMILTSKSDCTLKNNDLMYNKDLDFRKNLRATRSGLPVGFVAGEKYVRGYSLFSNFITISSLEADF
jgi:hypothetical protein